MNWKNKLVISLRSQMLRVCLVLSFGATTVRFAQAADMAPLEMRALTLHFPTNTPGLNRLVRTNGLGIAGWINTNTLLVVTATNCICQGYSNVAPFVVLQRLVQAYQSADVQAVQELYDPASRSVIASTLADAATRDRWTQFVTNIQTIVPLVIWNETNKIAAITWSLRGGLNPGDSAASLLPMVFDTNYQLMATELLSPAVNSLSAYFADGSRSPDGLLSTNNAASIKARPR